MLRFFVARSIDGDKGDAEGVAHECGRVFAVDVEVVAGVRAAVEADDKGGIWERLTLGRAGWPSLSRWRRWRG